MLSSEGTAVPGRILRRGSDGSYRAVEPGPPEPRIRRTELAPGAEDTKPIRSLLQLVHVTDLHVVDSQSPGRYEFMQRYYGEHPAFHIVIPAHRPHEALHIHACESFIRTINGVETSPVTGAPVDLLVSTGDNIDNQQGNELAWFSRLMRGGLLRPHSGLPSYQGVQAIDWDDPAYWHPDDVPDEMKLFFGFPTIPGLLNETMEPFAAEGLRHPWLSSYGNHDSLILGAAHSSPAFEEILTGNCKADRSPEGFIPEHLDDFIHAPARFLGPPYRTVSADPGRATVSRLQYRQALRVAQPGIDTQNTECDGTLAGIFTSVDDRIPGVRVISIDTTNPGGHFHGSVGARQAAWLRQRLIEVHACYCEVDGTPVHTGNDNRLVVLCSHHTSGTLTAGDPSPPDCEGYDEPRLLGPELQMILAAFPNLVLWLNGHTHTNRVVPHAGRSSGYWEVTTSSLIDWPCEGRLVELTQNDDGTLSIYCTMLGPDAPFDVTQADGTDRLTSIYREVAMNDPHAGWGSRLAGEPHDRTVELVLPSPFEIVR